MIISKIQVREVGRRKLKREAKQEEVGKRRKIGKGRRSQKDEGGNKRRSKTKQKRRIEMRSQSTQRRPKPCTIISKIHYV